MSKIKFNFLAKNAQGTVIKGKIEAFSEMEARARLRENNLKPISVKQTKKEATSSFFTKQLNSKEFLIFLRQFSVLLESGVPLLESLKSLAAGTSSKTLSETLKSLIESVEDGKMLHEGMRKHPKIFDPMVVNLVKVGEHGGVLSKILDELGVYLEKREKLKSKVIGALTYPVITIIIAFGALATILTFVIPKFEKLFAAKGAKLPQLTQTVVELSHALKENWYIVILGVVVLPLCLSFFYKSGPLRHLLDAAFLKVPLFGDLIKKSCVARMSRTLSILLKAGIRINDAMDITTGTIGNVIVDEYIIQAKKGVIAGKPFSQILKDTNFFPGIALQMILVGEKTGNLDSMLGRVADFYESEVEQTAGKLTSLLEPIIIVFLGGMVGTLVIAMFLPIFNMSNVL